jgi:hypothetical protein
MHEQVVHGLDVFGEESHCAGPFVEGTPRRARVVFGSTVMFDCRYRANRPIEGLFLPVAKTPRWNRQYRQTWNGWMDDRQENSQDNCRDKYRDKCRENFQDSILLFPNTTYVRRMTAAPTEG